MFKSGGGGETFASVTGGWKKKTVGKFWTSV